MTINFTVEKNFEQHKLMDKQYGQEENICMANRNETYKWWKKEMQNKIHIANEILDWENPIRGIYGIFIRENEDIYCAYVGRASNIYHRFFSSKAGHLVKIKDGNCENKRVNQALTVEAATIEIKVLEEVECQYDDYYKDMQRLAFAEYYHISKYQELNQCLEQLPDGSNMSEKDWKDERNKKQNMKLSNGINNS